MHEDDARKVAYDWHGGQSSPLYAFASTGHKSDGLRDEILDCLADAYNQEMPEDFSDLVSLATFLGYSDLRLWIVGRNMPGYLPESTPGAWTSWAQARDAIADNMRDWADYVDEFAGDRDDDDAGMLAYVSSVLTDDAPMPVQDWSWTLSDETTGFSLAFWLAEENVTNL
jgi:hypothetical protein